MTTTDRAFSFSRAYRRAQASGMADDEALGVALGADFATRESVLHRDNLLAGMPGTTSLVRLDSNGLTVDENVARALEGTPAEAEAREVLAEWQPRTTAAVFARARNAEFTPTERALLDEPSLGWSGGWGGHAVLSYTEILADGLAGLHARITAHMEAASTDSLPWYRGLLHVCDGMATFITHHADRADEMAAAATDEAEITHWRDIADCCRVITAGGAQDFRQAVQLFWFIHVLDNTDSPGRIDQFLYPYYLRLSDDAEVRRAAARPILDALWRNFITCRSWNVCIGGQTSEGHDAVNELSYLILDLQEHYNREAPNLSARFFAGTEPAFIVRCLAVVAHGSGMPALFNDEAIVPALCDLGITVEHARDYALNGCMQIDIQGQSHMGLEDGEVSLAKCLELALRAGSSPITNRQIGIPTLPAAEIGDFATLLAQYRAQVEYVTTLFTRQANLFQQTIAATAPHLFRSLFFSACLENGRDFKRGGSRYNHGQFLTQGIADTADSLYAIRRLVYDEQRLTLPELVAILDHNWEGADELRCEITERFPHYGNDVEEVDALAATVTELYFQYLRAQRTWRGGCYAGGAIVFVNAPRYGRHLAATADGRLAGTPVADSVGPARGRDRHGPTAMMRSVARLPHHRACSGFALNLKLAPRVFTGDGAARATALVRGYFAMGGQQVQINVVDAAVLRAAREHPEDHRHLVVRVGGFSARFVDLESALQDDIIARTEHQV